VNSIITITSDFADYTTSNNIFVSIGIVNPSTNVNTFYAYLYSYYYASDRYALTISTQTIYYVDISYTDVKYVLRSKSRIRMYPFYSRFTMVPNAPLRIRFKLTSGTITNSGLGKFLIKNSQITYSTAYLVYLR
jgi:hypothetical protein